MTTPPRPGSVSAMPNGAQLEIELLELSPDLGDKRKSLVKFLVLGSRPLFGPQFAKDGETYEGFCFESMVNYRVGDRVEAEAEYLGDAHQGVFQLCKLRTLSHD